MPKTELIHRFLTASAERYPDSPAVRDGERGLTFEELELRSNRMAHLLRDTGVKRGELVGLYLDKSVDAIAGVYAVLKAGAAYVPLDPDPKVPVARLAYMIKDCNIRHLITGKEKQAHWSPLNAHGSIEHLVVANAGPDDSLMAPARLGVHTSADVEAQPSAAPHVRIGEHDLAYILYTSGSTGAPKGVMLSHANSAAFVRWAVDEFAIAHRDTLSSHAPLHFDLSTFDLYAAALAGAPVVLVPRRASTLPVELARFLHAERITVWYSVPSILIHLIERTEIQADSVPALRLILFAGEVFPVKYLAELMERLSHVQYGNLYGPTETNVCTFYRVPAPLKREQPPIPIGKPIAGVETFLVDDHGALVTPGQPGEIWVSGATVMTGYRGDPSMTASRLVPHPVPGRHGALAYRTGDLARELPSGDYELIGRKDSQIKSRGYRIELGEIEAALYRCDRVVQCAAVAVPEPELGNRIIAFVVVRPGTRDSDLRAHCGQWIPRYMMPEEWIFRDSLPQTSTGKIDRRALISDQDAAACRRE